MRTDAWAVVWGALALSLMSSEARAESFEPEALRAASTLDVPALEEPSLSLPFSLAARAFYRNEDLAWTINGGPIDIRSELEWERVRSVGVTFDGVLELPHSLELRGQVEYGRIVAGEIQDSDFDGPGRTLEFSRSKSQTERGSVWDTSVALGWSRPLGLSFVVTPLIGLSYHQQSYNIRDGVQLIPPSGPAPLAGLDSDYDGEWYGFFWGLETSVRVSESCELLASFVSHQTKYDAEGHFNLRTDLGDPSFTHSTVAEGSTLRAGLRYALRSAWTLEVLARYRDWESDSGRTTFRLANGGASRQRFNDIDLRSLDLSIGLLYAF